MGWRDGDKKQLRALYLALMLKNRVGINVGYSFGFIPTWYMRNRDFECYVLGEIHWFFVKLHFEDFFVVRCECKLTDGQRSCTYSVLDNGLWTKNCPRRGRGRNLSIAKKRERTLGGEGIRPYQSNLTQDKLWKKKLNVVVEV